MRLKLHPLAAALAVLVSPIAFAAPDPSTLDAVTVEGARPSELPSAQELDPKALAGSRGADTAASLRELPGVSAYGAGGVSSLPVIRGLADDRLRIQVDGTDLVATCPNHMNPPLSYVAPSQVARVKVYAGITPVSVGGDSIGGSIVLGTAAPRFAIAGEDLVHGGELASYYRSNGDAFGVDAAFTLASEQFHLGYTGALAEADNYTAGGDFKRTMSTGRDGHTLPLDEVGSSAYRTRNHQLTAGWRSGAHLVDARIGLQDMPFQNYPNQRMDLTDNRAERINLHYRGEYSGMTLDARVWHEDVAHAMDFGADKRFWYGMASNVPGSMSEGRPCSPISYTCAAGMPMLSDSINNGGKLAAEFALGGKDLLRIGGELHAYRLQDYWPASGGGMWPGAFVNINDGERDRSAIYGEWEGSFGERWTHPVDFARAGGLRQTAAQQQRACQNSGPSAHRSLPLKCARSFRPAANAATPGPRGAGPPPRPPATRRRPVGVLRGLASGPARTGHSSPATRAPPVAARLPAAPVRVPRRPAPARPLPEPAARTRAADRRRPNAGSPSRGDAR